MKQLLLVLVAILFVSQFNSVECYKNAEECAVCELIFGSILTFLNESYAENDIEHAIDVVCNILPKSIKDKCYHFAQNLARFLITLPKLAKRQDYTPFALCSMYEYCQIDCCVSNAPEQVHLSTYELPSQMAATWVTRDKVDSVVYYGLSANNLNMKISGIAKTYTKGAWKGWIHHAVMVNLLPGTRYYYKVGSDQTGYSDVFNFYTEKTYVNGKTPIRICVYGDMGDDPQAEATISILEKRVANHDIDFIFHDGDISYDDGFQHRWDEFMRKIQNIAAYTPYMVTPGNHEIGVIGLLNVTLGYIHRFTLPGNHSASHDLENIYYSYNYGNVHIIALDTESILDIPLLTNEQYAWLENDLKTLDRKKYPWVVVFGHRPLYCSNADSECNKGQGAFSLYLRNKLEPLFLKYNVNIVFEAHKHDYERMWPVYAGKPQFSYNNPNYPTYVLSGAGGNREGTAGFKDRPNWSASAISEWGYGILTIWNNTHMEWDFYTSADNKIKDSFMIVQNGN